MNCVICNKVIEESMFTNKPLCSSECFQIDFWNDNVEAKDEPEIVRINGEQYYIGNENQNGFRGFCGRKFCIRFLDGREVVTTNLWYNGVIPEDFKERLPDNAEFIKDKNVESLIE